MSQPRAPGRSVSTQKHRIRRLTVDLRYADEPSAFRWRAAARELVEEVALPALEAALDDLAPDGRVVQIPRLVLDLGRLPDGVLERDDQRRALGLRIAAQLRDHAGALLAAVAVSTTAMEAAHRSAEEAAPDALPSLLDALIAFLGSGRLPWNAPFATLHEAEQILADLDPEAAQAAAAALLTALAAPAARRRFALQLAPETANWLVRAARAQAADTLLAAGRSLAGQLPQERWVEALLEVAVQPEAGAPLGPIEAARLWQAVVQAAAPAVPAAAIQPPNRPKADAPRRPVPGALDDEDGALYVTLAGVVLLHPFLPRLLSVLGLVDETRAFTSSAAQERALHLLHFLAAGTEEPEEHETVLLKLLCGLPQALPFARRVALSERERAECHALLSAVIAHWSKLGNTSIGALRETFLQREGKLERLEAGWRLTVEQRSLDILLGWLPWSLALVRLPWMDAPLWVDWA